jgi:hypothetical protein
VTVTTARRLAGGLGALALGGALVLTGAAPASAHVGNHLPDSKYYQSVITSEAPQVQGLDLSLIKSGESITLTNNTGKTVEVSGYTGEEYLRFDSQGVWQNNNSLSSFLNGSLVINGFAQQLSQGQGNKPPDWKNIAPGNTYSWHDHRMHWMAQERPPMVAAAPHQAHKVFDWSMNLTVGGSPVVVKGTLNWLGAPVIGGLAIALMVTGGTVLVALIGLLLVRRRITREREQVLAAAGHPLSSPAGDAVAS